MTQADANDTNEVQYLYQILCPLTEHPDSVYIKRSLDERGVFLTIALHPEDMGRIIGRNGDTSRAVRHLVRQFGMKNKSSIAIKILEPNQNGNQAEEII